MEHSITITDNAALKISQLIKAEGPEATGLRIEVLGGGCSGFQYNIFIENKSPDVADLIFTKNDAKIFIHNDYITLLNDTIVEYIDELGSARFELINPNATAKCGCGKSFGL
jgi:iron-sulfur cluster assembly accessory protein